MSWGFLSEDFLGTESCAGKTSSASTSMLMNFMRICSHSGSHYRLKLVTTHGQKISLGERIGCVEDLAQTIGKATLERLLEKAVQEFNSDPEVDFGAIFVSRAEGVTIRKWHGDERIRWEEIARYDFTSSHVGFHRFKKPFSVNVGTERVANALVLRALLDGVMRKVWGRSLG